MAYTIAGTDEIDSVVPEELGGMWFFRDALGCEKLGMTLLELEPDGKGKAHDHAAEDHEEVYLVVDGELTVRLGEDLSDERTLTAGEAIRVDPDTRRELHNHGEGTVRLAIAGAP